MKHQQLWISNKDIEIQIFEIKVRNIKKTLLLNVYCPPAGKVDIFIDSLTGTLNSIDKIEEYGIFITGDCYIPLQVQAIRT